MVNTKPLLLIPVENQVREMDPKLLLACIAAREGFSSVIGSRREMELNIDSFPHSIYLSKSMTVRSLLFFRAASRLGHEIVTWDEEALVHLPAETYFSRRLNPTAIRFVSHLFAWGQDNVDLWRQYPHLPKETSIHITGTPRSDMLRPEILPFYEKEVSELRRAHGNFILVNTNFNHVNAFGADMNLFKPANKPGKKQKFGRAARGMSREYAEGFRDHKQAVFENFLRLIPELDKSFPDHTIIVRPHPTENQEVYQSIASQCSHVRVTNAGNVVPWLMAAQALIHNGCTTGVEAFVMRIPAISYRAAVNDYYDNGFYRLPNKVSHQCFSLEELKETLRRILAGELGAASGEEREALIEHYLAAQDGPLACERIIDILQELASGQADQDNHPAGGRFERWLITKGLQLVRQVKSNLPGSHNRPEFQRHRYPGISTEELTQRVSLFQRLLGYEQSLDIKQVSDGIFHIGTQSEYSS
jgi:surface carbohydrate biosynthesis protein